ncbi:MAG: TackOD1 domain-containing metal-binding protein [Rhodospirillales bacterium]
MRISPLEQTARVMASPRLLVFGELPAIEPSTLPYRLVYDPEAEFDAIVVGEDGSSKDAVAAAELRPLAPVAALANPPCACAELRLGSPGLPTASAVLAETVDVVRRVGALPASVRTSASPALLLLARCATRAGGLAAAYDPVAPDFISYPAAGRIRDVRRHAEYLAEAGLLARSFFDRLHVCPGCQSSRLSVREECPACRGASIAEEPTVHHFACAQMALERAFRSGDGLVCPKCRSRLRHFGIDYEKPGVATVCDGCGHVDGEPEIGFRCVDCGAHHDAQAISLRDWYSYTLTPAGEEAVAHGALSPGSATPPAQTQTLRLLLRQGMAASGRARPLAVIGVTFTEATATAAEHSRRFAVRTRALAAEVIRGALRDVDFAADNDDGLVIYMPETEPAVGLARIECSLRRVRAVVAADLGAEANILDPALLLDTADRR